MDFTIVDLAECPEFLDVCAAWAFGLWGSQSGGSLEQSRANFDQAVRRSPDALTLVATRDGKAIGTVSLRDSDFEGRRDLKPWLASVYVHPEYRRSGLAHELVTRLQAAARQRGHDRLYLITEHSEGLYAGLGWTTFERVVGPHGPAVLMTRVLDAAATDPTP